MLCDLNDLVEQRLGCWRDRERIWRESSKEIYKTSRSGFCFKADVKSELYLAVGSLDAG